MSPRCPSSRWSRQVYDIEKVKPTEQIMMQLYPEIYSCVGCNACTKACTQGLNVMQYIAYAQRGEFEKCAEESFDCVMCGICSSRCPGGHLPPAGGHAGPPSQRQVHRAQVRASGRARARRFAEGKFKALIEDLMGKPIDEIKELYNHREIEK